MPCSNITELLHARIDLDDRLVSYRLEKESCGGSVGMPSLIKGWAAGRSLGELAAVSPEEFLAQMTTRTITGELVHLKHLFALQKMIAALSGASGAGVNDPCSLLSVEYSAEGIAVVALIRIDVMTAEIQACVGCGVH